MSPTNMAPLNHPTLIDSIEDGALLGVQVLTSYILGFLLLCYIIITKMKNPLSHLKLPPGPPIWPIVGNLMEFIGPNHPHHKIMAMHKKYGPIVHLKMGCVNVVTTHHLDLVKEILKDDESFSSRPHTMVTKYLEHHGIHVIGSSWTPIRCICMEHLLTTKRLDSFAPSREQEALFMLNTIWKSSREGKVAINMRDLLGGFSMNVMTWMLFGKRYFGMGELEALVFLDIAHKAFWLQGVFNLGDCFPFLRRFDVQGYESLLKEVHERIDTFLSPLLEEHRQWKQKLQPQDLDHAPRDFVDILLSLSGKNGEARLGDIEIKALIQDMIVTTIDTSLVTNEWAMSEIIRNEHILKKILDELDLVVGRDRLVSEFDLGKLHYLQAVMKETFRLHGALLITHESIKDTKVGGYDIPKNTQVLINNYCIGRRPDLWESHVEEFSPERWLKEGKGQSKHNDIHINNYEAMKFHGAPLGHHMVMLSLASLVQAFDWSLPPPLTPNQIDMSEAFGFAIPRAQPLLLVGIARLSDKLYHLGQPHT